MTQLDLTGKRFGRLLVVELVDKAEWRVLSGKKRVTFKCECDCGSKILCPSIFLTSGKQKSCGCIRKEKEHFACKTKIHKTWSDMMTRCYNPKRKFYYLYGGRGITVCPEWIGSNTKGFANFYDWSINNGYKEEVLNNGRNKLTLDRIDCDKGYSPENCRWITNEEQQNNKRADKLFEYNGECKAIKLWLKQYFVKCNDYYRLARLGLTNKNILGFVSSKQQIDINSKIGKGDRYKYTDNQNAVYDRITNKIWNKDDFLCSCTQPTHP